jgi:hypothetical protein
MKIKYIGDRKIINYTFMGRVIPNELTEINCQDFFGTHRFSEKELIIKLKENVNIQVIEVESVIEKKIEKEIEEKKTEVIADPVKDGIESKKRVRK